MQAIAWRSAAAVAVVVAVAVAVTVTEKNGAGYHVQRC